MKLWLQIVLTALVSAILTVFIYNRFSEPHVVYTQQNVSGEVKKVNDQRFITRYRPRAFLSSSPTDFIAAAKKCRPGVVYIRSKQLLESHPWLGEHYTSSSGSGVIISGDGFIATNNHVIANAQEIEVMLNDKREYKAELVGRDPTTDLALLKIREKDLSFLEFGNSDSLQVGEWVLAVGNPFRLQSTVTTGIVSAKGRNINILSDQQYGIESFIQTDAAVNPGNSGGALVNTNGELVGINTAILTHTGQYEGYSFAIPANLAGKVLNDLREFGVVQRGLLGINIQNVTREIAESYGLPDNNGVFVVNVFPGSGAADAGMKSEDIIRSVNGNSVSGIPALQEQVGRFRPGDTIALTYFRNGEEIDARAILKNQANSTELIATRRDKVLKDLGLEVRDLTQEEKRQYGSEGIKVLSIYKNSVIDRTNMIPGYIITHIDGRPIHDATDFIQQLERKSGKVKLEGFYKEYQGEFPYIFELKR